MFFLFFKQLTSNWFTGMSGGLSVPLAIAAFFVDPKPARVILYVTAIGCAIVAAYRVWAAERRFGLEERRDLHRRIAGLEERLAPKLKCSFLGADSGCVKSHVPLGNQVVANFYRIKVETNGSAQVASCYGRLRTIKRDGSTIFSDQPTRLPFSPSERADAVDKTIHEGNPEYLDFLVITNANKMFVWAADHDTQRGPKYGNLLGPPGDYEFEISVLSDTVPLSITASVRWRGLQRTAEII